MTDTHPDAGTPQDAGHRGTAREHPAREGPAPERTARGRSPVHRFVDPADTVLALLDHQTGILQTVTDLDPQVLRGNVLALAKAARVFDLPTVLTSSAPDGPNGPLLPELVDLLPDAPSIARPGQINAWDNRAFREAVQATGRGTIIMAGTVSSVCLMFPAIDAVANGYRVYGVVDASGTWSTMAGDATIARLTQAGVIVTDTLSVLAELQRDWRHPTAGAFAQLYHDHLPAYGSLMDSYAAATKQARPVQARPVQAHPGAAADARTAHT